MSPLQIAVRTILDNALSFDWSLQGFGLLRLYLRDDARLHIWVPEFAYDNVSVVHDHSWDLTSIVVAGRLQNQRYVESDNGCPYHKQQVVAGYNAHLLNQVENVMLQEKSSLEIYLPGDTYSQKAAEIHETIPDPYTVTLMQRKADVDGIATLYWLYGTSWGTAKPRQATLDEIKHSAHNALKLFE